MDTLIITRPVRSSRITQRFGQNRACVPVNGGRVKTCDGNNPPDGYRSLYGPGGHNGFDNATLRGEPVVHGATFPGWWHSEVDEAGGIGVDVVSNEPVWFPGDPPKGLAPASITVDRRGFTSYVKIRYWHLLTPIGWEKKQVKHGQIIGLADSTGASSGDHLHWAPKWCDKDGNTFLRDNGFNGCFDPTPYYTHELCALDAQDAVGLPTETLSTPERRQLNSQLSIFTRFLLELRESIYRLSK